MPVHRLQFDLADEALKEVEELRKETGFLTRAELIRNALKFLQWAVEQTRDGRNTLLVERDGKQREVIFPFWRPFQETTAKTGD